MYLCFSWYDKYNTCLPADSGAFRSLFTPSCCAPNYVSGLRLRLTCRVVACTRLLFCSLLPCLRLLSPSADTMLGSVFVKANNNVFNI